MHPVDGLVASCRHLVRISARRGLVTIALGLVFTIFLLLFWPKDRALKVQPDPTFYSSSKRNAFFLGSGATNDGDGLGQLVLETSQESQSIPYDPYPEYNSEAWKNTWRGTHRQCAGPNGTPLDRRNTETAMRGFYWNQSDFPAPIFGSYKAWKLDASICTDRYSRYAAYGYAEEDKESDNSTEVQWEDVNWATLQQGCLQRNADRYQPSSIRQKTLTLHKELDREPDNGTHPHVLREEKIQMDQNTTGIFKPRTAVVLRTWLDMKYTENDLHYIRSIIMELSLLSGAEYEVVLMVDAKDAELPNPADKEGLNNLRQSLPRELQDLAVFFNSKILEDWYPKIDVHVAILQYFQPMQVFSRLNPQYDFFWQFEMDSRYTGHFYNFLEQATSFAKQQPRKNLWERNSYFYIPAVHGTWDDFIDHVDQSMVGVDSIWGPQPAKDIDVGDEAPKPPHPDSDDDAWNWGVGEEADVITWLPHFNPQETGWPFSDRIFNFRQKGDTPRRASVVAMSRVSTRLLRIMHADKVEKGLGLASEMSLVSWSLYYGLKAVQVPHPIYHAHETNPDQLNRRANSGKPGKISAENDSIWTWDRHNDIVLKMSYMFSSEFPERIYRAWLGYDDAEKVSGFLLVLRLALVCQDYELIFANNTQGGSSSSLLASNVFTSGQEYETITIEWRSYILSTFPERASVIVM
ncbi:hypothetical protein N7457_004575 [Penicillium paradoxum]|uniref:uncharacterized protein n=1 Tax=Penicillium paradoxum TaxID=176176 RepID=UPI0025480F3C|nr:uncharacterized protein N7457_004575 [Penicillium paradoxum]KAJ5782801.1 hypothetical protein N7457_004575 [Penicillium paradoxum]